MSSRDSSGSLPMVLAERVAHVARTGGRVGAELPIEIALDDAIERRLRVDLAASRSAAMSP